MTSCPSLYKNMQRSVWSARRSSKWVDFLVLSSLPLCLCFNLFFKIAEHVLHEGSDNRRTVYRKIFFSSLIASFKFVQKPFCNPALHYPVFCFSHANTQDIHKATEKMPRCKVFESADRSRCSLSVTLYYHAFEFWTRPARRGRKCHLSH